jgi:ankyrin repeat protein
LNNPPSDLVQDIVDAAPHVVGWIDSHGYLPLHHACAHGAPRDVLSILIKAYPDGKSTQTMLHQETPLREFFQIVSLVSLGELRSWFVDGTNYLDVATIFMVLYSSTLMIKTDLGLNQRFQVFSALTKLILWLNFIV